MAEVAQTAPTHFGSMSERHMATPRRTLPTKASSNPSRNVAVIAGEKPICMTSVKPAR